MSDGPPVEIIDQAKLAAETRQKLNKATQTPENARVKKIMKDVVNKHLVANGEKVATGIR